jgi:hypothetical protein
MNEWSEIVIEQYCSTHHSKKTGVSGLDGGDDFLFNH